MDEIEVVIAEPTAEIEVVLPAPAPEPLHVQGSLGIELGPTPESAAVRLTPG